MINIVMIAEEHRREDKPEKGAPLRTRLMKRNVTFSRFPERYVIIVNVRPKLSHCA
jgi:hypothetical protein